jgi:hypothetical protein
MASSFLLLKLLHRLPTTLLQVEKQIGMHSLDASLQTRVQKRQVYVGLHHLVQMLHCNQTLCVCVRAPKV